MALKFVERSPSRRSGWISVTLAYLFLVICFWVVYYPLLRVVDFPGKFFVWLCIPFGYLAILFWYGYNAGHRPLLLLHLPFIGFLQQFFYQACAANYLCHECEDETGLKSASTSWSSILWAVGWISIPVFVGFVVYFLRTPRVTHIANSNDGDHE